MKPSIFILAFVAAAVSSCTSVYKTGQTPDDVYFSPERPQAEYVTTNNDDNRYYYNNDDYYADRYLRMKVHNRLLWSDLDDWYYYGNRYNYSYYNNFYWNNPWSPYTYWNYYYNPYYSPFVIVNPKSSYTYNRPRMFNLNTYNNNQLTRGNYSKRSLTLTIATVTGAPTATIITITVAIMPAVFCAMCLGIITLPAVQILLPDPIIQIPAVTVVQAVPVHRVAAEQRLCGNFKNQL
jgi:hypothetical protein